MRTGFAVLLTAALSIALALALQQTILFAEAELGKQWAMPAMLVVGIPASYPIHLFLEWASRFSAPRLA